VRLHLYLNKGAYPIAQRHLNEVPIPVWFSPYRSGRLSCFTLLHHATYQYKTTLQLHLSGAGIHHVGTMTNDYDYGRASCAMRRLLGIFFIKKCRLPAGTCITKSQLPYQMRSPMAVVENQILHIEKSNNTRQMADLDFMISFSQRELEENVTFGLYIAVLQSDSEFEKYHQNPNGVFYFNLSMFNPFYNTGFIHWFESKTIQPNGSTKLHFHFEKSLMPNELSDNQNSYRAFIFVVPEITCGQAYTENVCVNYH
jgi:hypothetical protein